MSSVKLSEIIYDTNHAGRQTGSKYLDVLGDIPFSCVATVISKRAEDVLNVEISLSEKLFREIQDQLSDRINNMRYPDDSVIVQTTVYKDSLDWKSSMSYDAVMGPNNFQIPTAGPKILMQMRGTIDLKLMMREGPGASKSYELRGKVVSARVDKCGNGAQWF